MLLLEGSPLTLSPADQRHALLHLICALAYREGRFTLTSGRQSDYYINCKPVTLHPQGAYLIGQRVLALLPNSTQAVAGMTLGADPILSAVSIASLAPPQGGAANLPALIVRKQPKGHGTQVWIEGPSLAAGTRVWILEDVVTTGGSALLAAERVRETGYQVEGILTVVDRLEGAAAACDRAGVPLRCLFTIGEVREFFRQHRPRVSGSEAEDLGWDSRIE